jgi:exopolysaccharide production protein ExoZ
LATLHELKRYEIQTSNRFVTLDIFRGIAIIWIMCFHVLDDIKDNYGYFWGDFIIGNGHLGVEIFFIISGFGISKSIEHVFKNDISINEFLKKRLLHIYLPYFFCLIFSALIIPICMGFLSYYKGNTLEFPFYNYTFSEWIQVISLLKVFSATTWRLDHSFVPINSAFWYLSIIAQIYFFVAISAVFKPIYYRIIAFLTLLSFLTLLPCIKNLVVFGFFLPYWIEFSIGIMLYFIIDRKIFLNYQSKVPKCFSLIIGPFIITSFFIACYFSLKIMFSFTIGILFWLVYPIDKKISKTYLGQLLSFIGSFSYSLYLMHNPLKKIIAMLVRYLIPLPYNLSYPFFLIPFIIILSFIWYLFFEKPMLLSGTVKALLHPMRTIKNGFSLYTVH